MNELEVLRKYWKRDESFPRIEQDTIRRMIYDSSSSLVKWIFFLSVLEFTIGIAFGAWYIFFEPEIGRRDYPSWLELTTNVIDIAAYLAIIYFMYRFFNSYKRIKNTNNTKTLLNDILETRRNVHHYIRINIYFVALTMLAMGLNRLINGDLGSGSPGQVIMSATVLLVVFLFISGVCIALIKLYYRLVYLRLVKKLDRNYKELIRLDDESDVDPSE